jgi:hypothetical protein
VSNIKLKEVDILPGSFSNSSNGSVSSGKSQSINETSTGFGCGFFGVELPLRDLGVFDAD